MLMLDLLVAVFAISLTSHTLRSVVSDRTGVLAGGTILHDICQIEPRA